VSLKDDIRRLADEVLANGGDREDLQIALYSKFEVTIGKGGNGRDDLLFDFPPCRYCGAWGGGGHGGFCPNGGD
jgi:hypothetical protein